MNNIEIIFKIKNYVFYKKFDKTTNKSYYVLEDKKNCRADYPLFIANKVYYDNPEVFPYYIRKKVLNYFRSYKSN